jgi:hypothetical protein
LTLNFRSTLLDPGEHKGRKPKECDDAKHEQGCGQIRRASPRTDACGWTQGMADRYHVSTRKDCCKMPALAMERATASQTAANVTRIPSTTR